MGDPRDEYEARVAFPSNTHYFESHDLQAADENLRRLDQLFSRDPAPYTHQAPRTTFNLESIVNATHATIKYGPKMFKFMIIPSGNIPDRPRTFIITDVDDTYAYNEEKETFLKDIVEKQLPIVLTVGHEETQNIILRRDPASSCILGGVYVFESVKGEGGGGCAAGGGVGVGGGGKSVRRRSRKRYSRRRRVSNKKYSASRRGRGRGRGRRSRKN
jgi:hypothetical protein